jgi:subtilisin-like proprotein convertase family protein
MRTKHVFHDLLGFEHSWQLLTDFRGLGPTRGGEDGMVTPGGISLFTSPPPDTVLQLGVRDNAQYGQNYNGQTDADGLVQASFAGTGEDLLLTFDGFDIDNANEVEVLLNGVSLGTLAAGVNNGLSAYQFLISAEQQAGDNTISFVQLGNPAWTWGVTNILIEAAGPAMTLTLGETETGSYGNNFDGMSDADGRIQARFSGTGEELILTFDGFDIDNASEVEVLLNGVSLGVLAAGIDNGLASYQFVIDAALQQAGENILSFNQLGNAAWAWGVTNILLAEHQPDPAIPLTLSVRETGEYGQNFNGQTDADGLVEASFTGTGEDLLLTFGGFDIDNANEVEVLLNGSSLGILSAGIDGGLASYQFLIDGTAQLAGENTIGFVQLGDAAWTWGVTDILLEAAGPAMTLTVDTMETGSYGNNFAGMSDGDGLVQASFSSAGQDLLLTFDGYDIDTSAEVEVLLNGVSLGILSAGIDSGLVSYQFVISDTEQLAGENILSFSQIGEVSWNWGVTNILLTEFQPDAPILLTQSVRDTGQYGQNFNGQTDADGLVQASFEGTGEDTLLTFGGFDVDNANEIEVLLNGSSLGVLAAGIDSGLATYQFLIDGIDQQAGDNTISFVQLGDVAWTWGVTDILLEAAGPAMTLTIGEMETGSYGNNFAGMSDADGIVQASFAGTCQDLLLTFDGFDIDDGNEVEVLLNGVSLGILSAGVDNDLVSYEFLISYDLQAHDNILSFVQRGSASWNWGVTDILLAELPEEEPIALELGVLETGKYGNNFDGVRDFDGVVDATFTDTGEDLLLSFNGFDIDTNVEVEVFLNGESLGFLTAGVDNDLTAYEFEITADQQIAGENTISFVQQGEITWNWGVTDIRIDPLPDEFTPTDTNYGDQWHLRVIGNIERIWAEHTGQGVAVGIYDNGLQHSHHDLNDNYDASKQLVVKGKVVDPADGVSDHGTAVAGVIAAEANGVGTVGVAFGSSITGVNIFSGVASANSPNLSGFGDAMMQMDTFDVVNHSWGWTPPFTPDSPPADDFLATVLPTLENAAVNGRGGLGTVIVKAAGNESASAQGEQFNSSRFAINVGATDDDGDIAWYSNHGANLLVTAPSSGGFLFNLGIKTTDLLGADGYTSGDYTGTDAFTGFGGTSSAAPVVSGVAALMLDANPDLGWRDVQKILAYSATHAGTAINAAPVAFGDEDHVWRFNGADNWNGGGLHFSEDYGFGDVDAFNAVRMAEVWHQFDAPQTSANEAQVTRSSAPNLSIGTATTIDLDLSGVALDVEHAQVSISLSDSTVDIFLTSPDGTQVQLYRSGDAPAGPLEWTFGAQAFRGEDADGIWALNIVNSDGSGAVLADYTIDWYGRSDTGPSTSNDVFHFTDEIFASTIFDVTTGQLTAITDDTVRSTVTDTDGGVDWLNMAAMTGNLDVSLAGGDVSTSSGAYFLTVAAGADIENAVAGDGHDSLSGNALDNILMGMRGNDQIFGLGGSDRLTGGAGDDGLWGGVGADFFVFEAGFGQDVIYDFDASLANTGSADAIDFRGLSEIANFTEVMDALTQTAQGAVYDYGTDGQDVLIFAGLNIEELSSQDFLIV